MELYSLAYQIENIISGGNLDGMAVFAIVAIAAGLFYRNVKRSLNQVP